MTTLPPEDADSAAEEGRGEVDIDAEFAAIVARMSGSMTWTTTGDELGSTALAGIDPAPRRGGSTGTATPDPWQAPGDTEGSTEEKLAAERERRRALRRAERAAEVAEFEAARAQLESEIDSDDAHFVPPEPPPIPRPGRRTVVALLLIILGLALIVRPSLLSVAADLALVLGALLVGSGFGLLIYGLRQEPVDDPGDPEGWDNGARF